MEIVSANTLVYVGVTLGIGYIIGIAIRKATTFILTLSGLYFLSLLALANMGIVAINWSALANLLSKLVERGFGSLTTGIGVLSVPMVVGITLGILSSKCVAKRSKYWVRRW